MKNNLFFSGLVALIVSLSSIGIFNLTSNNSKSVKIEHITSSPSRAAIYSNHEDGISIPLDFNKPAEKVLNAVVHIKSTRVFANNRQGYQFGNVPEPFRDFFDNGMGQFQIPKATPRSNKPQTQVGTGSGVIISEDGYIVTNNHVIENADDIEVALSDNRIYKALVVGTDPSTDLALLQIKEKGLPTVPFINSDDVRIGEWVLAVGNPMGLNSTVTAGIVSAKGRSINILKDQYAVENFIQTDAAINPGNSGGALINLDGGLVGINTAIASPTGSFAGYGFAIPANIVNKVIEDLLEYGTVQRGVLGVIIRTLDGNLAKEKDLSIMQGVYVDSLLENSAAAKAGIKAGDVITAVNDTKVGSSSELQGLIARYRPGESIILSVNRSDKLKTFDVTLNNRSGNTALASKDERLILKKMGVELEELDEELIKRLDISGGVKVSKLHAGKLRNHTQMREGFIITYVDSKKVKSIEELLDVLETKKGGVMLKGIYEDIPGEYYYAFGLD